MKRSFILFISFLIATCNIFSVALRTSQPPSFRGIGSRLGLRKLDSSGHFGRRSFALRSIDPSNEEDMHQKMRNNDFDGAIQLLKRNPMVHLGTEDARSLLNYIEEQSRGDKESEAESKELIDNCVLVYKRLERQHVLKGFGCVEGEYPDSSVGEVTPAKLQQVTGIDISALTPKERTTYWRIVGISLCIFEYFLGESIGIDPLFTLIPATFAIFGADQLFYRGAGFESIYQKLFPEYKKKIVCHEAGHFLISYLLGIPVRGCVTNAWEARKYPEIKGQAGTIFYDPKLADELAGQKITRKTMDRMSVVLMAGIAAEALEFGKSEGGTVDEQALKGFLTSISPPWNILRIQSQARWAVMQAILLIKEHKESYNALVQALEQGKCVGDCVLAIEQNLPSVLPSKVRVQERKEKSKTNELDLLMRYIQKVTWRVGGISPVDYEGDAILGPNPHDGKIGLKSDLEDTMLGASSAAPTGGSSSGAAVVGLDGYIVGVKKENAVEEKAVGEDQGQEQGQGQVADRDEAVRLFKEKIRRLEDAAQAGRLDVEEKSEGGVWLNDLTALKTPASGSSSTAEKAKPSLPSLQMPGDIVIPEPIEGYEKRIEEMLKAEGGAEVNAHSDDGSGSSGDEHKESTDNESEVPKPPAVDLGIPLMQSRDRGLVASGREQDLVSSTGLSTATPEEMLRSHRGYQMKRLENIKACYAKKAQDTDARIAELSQIMKEKSLTVAK